MMWLRLMGLIVAVLALSAAGFALMVFLIEAKLSDGALIAICLASAVAAPTCIKFGARLHMNKWLGLVSIPLLSGGITILMITSDRYQLLAPWTVGAVTVCLFTLAGSAMSWRSIGGLASAQAVDAAPGMVQGNVIAAALIYAAVGGLAVFPMVILLNGQGTAGVTRILPGTVAEAYEVNGKDTSRYIRLTGPAAAYRATWTAGEFSVDSATFQTSKVGAQKCLTVKTGLLHFRWWSIGDC